MRERQIVRIVQQQSRTLECSADRNSHTDIANVGASLTRLTNRVNCADVERWIQIGVPKKRRLPLSTYKRRAAEGIDKIEAIGSADRVQRSLQSELRRLASLGILAERDIERAAKLDVCF